MIVVTGGAGFIGSALVWGLNRRGERRIVVVDNITHEEQRHNLEGLTFDRLIGIEEFRAELTRGVYDGGGVRAVLHMGACSSTLERRWDYLQRVNVSYSQDVIRWCGEHDVQCVYASSGATYGDGRQGYSDAHERFDRLQPLNPYGRSKLIVDIWARDAGCLERAVGLRYFNVFGPNEYHKGHMRSVIIKAFEQERDTGIIELYKSYRADIPHGEQRRDFLYVKDAVEATLFFLDHPDRHGVFNVGTGEARSWNEVAQAVFAAMHREPKIRYIAMPEAMRAQYQYYTCADVTKLRGAGYTRAWTELAEAVGDYVRCYLRPHLHLGQEESIKP